MKLNTSNTTAVVVGASRGLGAALVDRLLATGYGAVVGMARTDVAKIESAACWIATGRYRHVAGDIGDPSSISCLRNAMDPVTGPLVAIFCAADLRQDVRPDRSLIPETFTTATRTGVMGFGHMLQATGKPLQDHGGVLAAISSINALRPPLLEHRVAYGASKAYIAMAMRDLSQAWGVGGARFLTFHLGHVGQGHDRGILPLFFRPSYRRTATFICRKISGCRSSEIIYPWFYVPVYDGLARLLPDGLFIRLLGRLLPRAGAGYDTGAGA